MKEPMSGKKKSAPTAPIKVKQDMIDFIKNQGMTAALKRAGSINAKGGKGEAEFLEGVRRMYGASRLAAATKAAMPAKSAPRGAMVDMGKTTSSKMPTPKMPGKGPAANMAKSSTSPKPTAQQMAQAKARAGGNQNIKSTPKPKSVETAAQKAAKAAMTKKRRDAMAAAVKRAGGRTL
jgi:hypothetical protein